MSEAERLSRDKAQLQRQLNERGDELLSAQATSERLSVQLAEREKNLQQLQQQHERVAGLMEESSKDRTNYKQERDALQVKFNEKIIETEELRKVRDSVTRKLKLREKRVQVRACGCLRRSLADARVRESAVESLFVCW